MATLTDLETRVLNILGDPNKRRWATSEYTTEIQDLLVEGIRLIAELVVKDALTGLLNNQSYTIPSSLIELESGIYGIYAPATLLYPLSISAEESDGNMGVAWNFVSSSVIKEARYVESNMGQDSTGIRMWAIWSLKHSVYAQTYELYPTPEDGRNFRLEYIKKPSESGTMTISNLLQIAAVEYAISVAAAKKSFDLNMSDRFDARWRRTVAAINAKNMNVYGLTSAEVGVVRDVM